MADETDPTAPHGRDENGTPLAPYGHKANGDPRLSNRGRPAANAGPKVAAPPKKASGSKSTTKKTRTKAETKGQLLELVGLVTTPLVKAAHAPAVVKRLGERQATALAGDAVILEALAPDIIDGVMAYAEVKPGLLAWMDKAEEYGPAVLLARAGAQVAVALVQNHMNPNPDLARASRAMVNVKALRFAAAIEEEARAYEAVQAEADRAAGERLASVPEQRVA